MSKEKETQKEIARQQLDELMDEVYASAEIEEDREVSIEAWEAEEKIKRELRDEYDRAEQAWLSLLEWDLEEMRRDHLIRKPCPRKRRRR